VADAGTAAMRQVDPQVRAALIARLRTMRGDGETLSFDARRVMRSGGGAGGVAR